MTDWTKKKYNEYYTSYMPWIEDKVLGYWGENKTSYTAKGTSNPLHPASAFSLPSTLPPTLPSPILSSLPPHPNTLASALTLLPPDKLSTDITGEKNINAIQGGVAEGVGGTLSSGGILGGVGDLSSKEGVNRAERGDPGLGDVPGAKQAEKEQKGWTETLSGGYLGGGGKK